MELRILFVDDEDLRDDLADYFNDKIISGYKLVSDTAASFDIGIEKIRHTNYDIVVLDLCQGVPSDDASKEGLKVLEVIQNFTFIPVVFFSGIAHSIVDLNSEIVYVANKADGFEELESKIEKLISSKIALIKSKIHSHIEEELRNYFWDIIHSKRDIFRQNATGYSLGYLLLRRLAHSLSKENIKEILDDSNIKTDKSHPMEFYIFPSNEKEEYEVGEILLKEGQYYTVLTPSCDFIEDKLNKRERRVGKVLLAVAQLFSSTGYYHDYIKNPTKNKDRVSKIIETRKGDQFFFLPGTPFIDNLLLDFQNKIMVDYSDLNGYTRVAKLDDPFAQSMVSSFVRYYNRIGFPDLDSEFVLSEIK